MKKQFLNQMFTPFSLAKGDMGGESVSVMLDFLCLKESIELSDDAADTELGDRFRLVDRPLGGGPKNS